MGKKEKIVMPIYQQIAIDIASKIASGKYKVGEKIYGRSSLASQYSVSPETIRRAIYILKDVEIVDTERGSGIEIISLENAISFMKQYEDIETIHDLKKDIFNCLEEREKSDRELREKLDTLLDKTDRFQWANPFFPFEIEITKANRYLGKNVSELNFWHNTGATIIAIKRRNAIIISPGPYANFLENDIFYFIGEENSYQRVKNFLYSQEENK